MLILDPSSHCDVCCESFTSLPHCIECGHIFCADCLDAICEKTWSPRSQPACPFCREPFTKETVRKIRVDLKTPRPPLKEIDDDDDDPNDNLSSPSEAKRLEEKVARAAASKCSFEEVSELHKEIQQWLTAEVKRTSAGQHASLQLSAALLKAILLNCLAYSEASKVAKGVETSLKEKLDTAQSIKEHLDAELRKHRSLYSQKVRECQELRSELNRLKLTTVPTNSSARSFGMTAPTRPSSPAPFSRTSSVRSTMTPPPQQAQRAYFSRPASTVPTMSNMGSNARSLFVGSAPTSNTMASAIKYQTSPTKLRPAPSRYIPVTEEDSPPERWIPASDDESVVSEKRHSDTSTDRFSFGNSLADRMMPASSGPVKWTPHRHMPPVEF